jgi:L-asparaginase
MIVRTALAIWLISELCSPVASAATKTGETDLPNVVILATGGTIAGEARSTTDAAYTAGRLSVEVLIDAVPEIRKIADVRGEQICNIASQDMTDVIWLKLARRVNELLASDAVDGIVVTHGTDTMEETAYFLHLVVKGRKPVVLTGAMRPPTSLSSDGSRNLYDAVAVAADPAAAGRGVLVVLNEEIHGARAVTKTSTTAVETFASPGTGPVGAARYGEIRYYHNPPGTRDTLETQFSIERRDALPRVDIIYAHADMAGDLIDAAVAAGARGIVVAGVGNGNMSQAALASLARAAEQGVVCVRSRRLAAGFVGRNIEVDDDRLGFVASCDLNPQKARVLLKLVLTETRDPAVIQKMFETY